MADPSHIRKWVRQIVEDNSGGIKFTALIPALIDVMETEGCSDWSKEGFIDELESIVLDHPELAVLNYTWKTLSRAKMFVYTP